MKQTFGKTQYTPPISPIKSKPIGMISDIYFEHYLTISNYCGLTNINNAEIEHDVCLMLASAVLYRKYRLIYYVIGSLCFSSRKYLHKKIYFS